MSTGRAFNEIEVAYLLNYESWRDFQKARKAGFVPRESFHTPGGPRWSETSLAPLLRPDGDELTVAIEEKKIIERLDRGDTAPLPRQGKARR